MKKCVLFIGTGSHKKNYFIDTGREYDILLLTNKKVTWEQEYIKEYRMIDSFDKSSALRAVEELRQSHDIAAALVISEPYVEIAGAIFDYLGLPGISEATAKRCRDKFVMKECLLQNGVPTARGFRVNTREEFMEKALLMEVPFIVKPLGSWGSYGVQKIYDKSPENLESIYDTTIEFTSAMHRDITLIVEEYMEGAELTVESLVYRGEVIPVAVTDKPTPLVGPYFMESDDVLHFERPEDEEEKILEINKNALKALGIENGAAHLELRHTPGGYKVLEVGCRLGGEYIHDEIEISHGINIFNEYLKIALGIRPQIERKKLKTSGFVRFFRYKEGVIRAIRGVEEVRQWPGVQWVRLDASVGQRHSLPPKEYRVCLGAAFVVGDSYKEVVELMKRIDENIVIDIY